jgi:putative toxin-antitoxin system antitoxin component (TIGR02293 family)
MGKSKEQVSPLTNLTDLDEQDISLLMKQAKQGVSFQAFKQMVENTPFSEKEWAQFLHLSERTLQRYGKAKMRFDPLRSEKILEVALLLKKGIEVFGDKNRFYEWLKTANTALEAVKPKDLLDNTFGINHVKDELTKIEHGILA